MGVHTFSSRFISIVSSDEDQLLKANFAELQDPACIFTYRSRNAITVDGHLTACDEQLITLPQSVGVPLLIGRMIGEMIR